jgi:hypothetical protein
MTSPYEFRDEFLELMLRFLWRHWSALGVAGRGAGRQVVDPEALLLFTCSIGRFDARLFDEVIDWLLANERFVNVQRLKALLKTESLGGGAVMRALAELLAERGSPRKWRQLAGCPRAGDVAALFLKPDGTPLPAIGDPEPSFARQGWLRPPLIRRGMSGSLPLGQPATLWLRLRAFFGVNARCEILLYLLLTGRGGSAEIATKTGLNRRTVQDAIREMAVSGLLTSQRLGRDRLYTLRSPQTWAELLGIESQPGWICWAPLISALEAIWSQLNNATIASRSPMMQLSELRRIMDVSARPCLLRSGLSFAEADVTQAEQWANMLREVLAT